MESFKVYLPSNASTHLYPENTPSDYRTRLDQAINVDGDWEVGLESIFYSPNIHDDKEKAQIHFQTNSAINVPINGKHPFELTNATGKWSAISEVTPKDYETDPKETLRIIASINSVNTLILNPYKRKNVSGDVFRFSLTDDNKVVYLSYSDGFTLSISTNLARVLGFGYRTTFSNTIPITASSKRDMLSLHEKDYKMSYFNTEVLKQIERIDIMTDFESYDGTEKSFIERWNKTVKAKYDVGVSIKSKKLVIENYNSDIIINFRPQFSDTFGHAWPIFERGSHWGLTAVKLDKPLKKIRREEWRVDIYSKEPAMTTSETQRSFTMDIFPWRYVKYNNLFTYINRTVSSFLKKKLNTEYDVIKHHFSMSLHSTDRCKLVLGDWLSVTLSENLTYLLALPMKETKETEVIGMREMTSLTDRKRQLLLLSNVIKPVAFGNHKLQIMQDFLHSATGNEAIERRFYPIVYLPLMHNYMDMIHIQLTDEFYKPVAIKDSKTIVTLYFRKVKAI